MVPVKKMKRIEEKIRNECSCQGAGCLECRSYISRLRSYDKADIPIDYWILPFKDFSGDQRFKEFISKQLQDVSVMYDKGISLAFVGNLGIGKTYAACSILKMSIVNGFSAKYANMVDIIDRAVRNDYEFVNEITSVDFLVIDEYDSRWVFPSEKSEQLFGQTMERVFRHRFQNQMPTIICSNTPDLKNVLADDFSRSVDSLFSKFMKVLYVSGKDFRKIQK